MHYQNFAELLNDNCYPSAIDVSTPLGELLLKSFDYLAANHHEWTYGAEELRASFASRWSHLRVVDVVGGYPAGQVIPSEYALSVDETADYQSNCNYEAFSASMMNAWANRKLPTEEILALLIDARAAVEYRNSVRGLHYVH